MRVLGNLIVTTLPEDKSYTTASGILIEEHALEDTNKALNTAETVTILEIGTKVEDKRLIKGAKIAILGKSGNKQEVEGETIMFVREPNILAIL